MKIHHNPGFSRPNTRAEKSDRQDSSTRSFLSKLQADNAAELDRLADFYSPSFPMEEAKERPIPHSPIGAKTETQVDDLHVHTISSTTRSSPCRNCMHNHRFGGVTGAPIPVPGGHIHFVNGQTESGKKP